MIARIRGRVLSADTSCVVDVGGVGFELLVPEKDRESMTPGATEVSFYTYLYVREDRLTLFGFLRRVDRDLFLKLIDVSGVGPRLALGVLSTHTAEAVVAAIRRGEFAFLQRLPGVGKKTAERICMELGDKLDSFAAEETATGAASSKVRDDVILALTGLGLTKSSAEAVLERMRWVPDDGSSVEAVVREALRYTGGA